MTVLIFLRSARSGFDTPCASAKGWMLRQVALGLPRRALPRRTVMFEEYDAHRRTSVVRDAGGIARILCSSGSLRCRQGDDAGRSCRTPLSASVIASYSSVRTRHLNLSCAACRTELPRPGRASNTASCVGQAAIRPHHRRVPRDLLRPAEVWEAGVLWATIKTPATTRRRGAIDAAFEARAKAAFQGAGGEINGARCRNARPSSRSCRHSGAQRAAQDQRYAAHDLSA